MSKYITDRQSNTEVEIVKRLVLIADQLRVLSEKKPTGPRMLKAFEECIRLIKDFLESETIWSDLISKQLDNVGSVDYPPERGSFVSFEQSVFSESGASKEQIQYTKLQISRILNDPNEESLRSVSLEKLKNALKTLLNDLEFDRSKLIAAQSSDNADTKQTANTETRRKLKKYSKALVGITTIGANGIIAVLLPIKAAAFTPVSTYLGIRITNKALDDN